jgi:hypothetical protein
VLSATEFALHNPVIPHMSVRRPPSAFAAG